MVITPRIESIVDLALEAGKKHRERVMAMRRALEAGDEKQALELAREVCGLSRPARSQGHAA